MKTQTKTIRIPAHIADAVLDKYSQHAMQGLSWLISSIAARDVGVPAPHTPNEARSIGGKAGVGEAKSRKKKLPILQNNS